jgi:hypothetical protein
MNYFPCDLILNQKIERIKLCENYVIICKVVIICKAMNGEKIFGSMRYMEDIAKMKILNRVTNY